MTQHSLHENIVCRSHRPCFEDEIHVELKHTGAGVLSMANRSDSSILGSRSSMQGNVDYLISSFHEFLVKGTCG